MTEVKKEGGNELWSARIKGPIQPTRQNFSVLTSRCLAYVSSPGHKKFCLLISPPKIKPKAPPVLIFSLPALILEAASSPPTHEACLAHSPAALNVTRSSEVCSAANTFYHFLCSSHACLDFQSYCSINQELF